VHLLLIIAIQAAPLWRNSGQALLRHMSETAYGCFLPDLTRFTGTHCGGPVRQRLP